MSISTNVIDNIFDDFDESFIRGFSLAITLRVIWCGPLMFDMELITEGFDIFIFKGFSIIRDND